MLTDDRVIAAMASATELERAVKAQIGVEVEAARQRRALAVFRHVHALRIALDDWQEQTRQVAQG